LPGDLYRLGLQMCAVVAASAETRVLFLGAHTPPDEMVKVAREHRALAVSISISHAMDLRHVAPTLEQLRMDLPTSIPIVIGGAGAPREVEGVLKLADMRAFHDWLRARRLGV
jgi:MerR family transcriptional regulator, light-induced transcriptional regulator